MKINEISVEIIEISMKILIVEMMKILKISMEMDWNNGNNYGNVGSNIIK